MRILTRYLLAACVIAVAMAKAVDDNQALHAVSQGTNAFSSQLFQTVVEANPGNLIMSPLSAAVVLAMAAYGSRGETENQLRKVLHLPSLDNLGTSGYQALIDNIDNVTENTLALANKVFTAEKYSVKPSYRELTETYFRSVTQLVNFVKSDEAANTINTWVKEQTNNRIVDIVSPDDLDDSTALVLVNAVYFKGRWKNEFDPYSTEDIPFHVNENTVKNVPTMQRQGSYKYGKLPNLNARFVVIPYQGNELSMVIILPNEINGLPMVEKKLQGMSIADILNHGYEREVDLRLPKFKIEKKINLNSVLKKMGLTDMFTARANFSGISDDQLVVSKVVQKAFIEVNEEGSEATAVVASMFVTLYSFRETWQPMQPIQFYVDRPFLSIVLYGDVMLFLANVVMTI